ncbi:MAG: toprim domain-containing protein [Thermoproteota archaeon]
MSTQLKEKEEKILEILNRLAKENAKGIPVVVEGKKDVESLRALAVSGEMLEAKTGGKSLVEIVSEISEYGGREVILLLDFDRRGRKLTKNLKQNLERMKIKPNIFFWRRLRGVVGHDVKDIEGLPSYLDTLREKIAGLN